MIKQPDALLAAEELSEVKTTNPRIPVLCLLPGPMPLSQIPGEHEFWVLSKYFKGFVLSPVWEDGSSSQDATVRARFDQFEYYTQCTIRYRTIFRVIANFFFYIRMGRALHKQMPYDAIIAYGPFTTAWAGYVLKKLTKAKLIVEFPGNPTNSFLLNSPYPSFIDRAKTWFSRISSPLAVRLADHVRLLYHEQLGLVTKVRPEKTSSFHYYTPIKAILPGNICDPYILCLGGPWYRKGADVLIAAFLRICDEFPNTELRIIGYGPNREYFENLAARQPRIKICKPISHAEAVEQIRRCSVFACPSRSEGFPRVIAEAMTAAKPIVASAVDGIPSYLRDDVNGLLVPSEDAEALADRIAEVLRDEALAKRLGNQARIDALQSMTEDHYAEQYRKMVEFAIKNGALKNTSHY